MAITNPEAIRFVNEVIRPLCEAVRTLKVNTTAAGTVWFGGINNLIPNTSEAVNDGRDGEGVSRLTGADVNNVMSALLAITPDAAVIQKPCVRQLP